jgi:HTH-type transcriptional regulator / antitoxin HigA
MKPKLIKTAADHATALARIEELFAAKPGTPDGDELDLLITLAELYEEKHFPINLPDPVAAIRFRMSQQRLKPKDLVPYIGSAPRVSEVLSGKRPLSLAMIRKLVKGLGIPAEVLLQEPGANLPSEEILEQGRRLPIAEMVKRRWFAGFTGTVVEAKQQLEELLGRFMEPLGEASLSPALNRQCVRDGGKDDPNALTAWRIRVATLALEQDLPAYRAGTVDIGFLRELAKLSYLDSGPRLAKEFLGKAGVHMVIERHLPHTHLDGAAMKLPSGAPLVGLTLRHDRLDNFWFTLFHELAHVALHLDRGEIEVFFDDITKTSKDRCEKEADEMASEALIPGDLWKGAKLRRNTPPDHVVAFAEKLRIHPAIPAGRIRFENHDYKVMKTLIGSGRVRAMFGFEK